MGHLVKGDGADTISQSWNVPGSLNLGCSTFSGLPDKTGCSVFCLFFAKDTLPCAAAGFDEDEPSGTSR